MSTQNPPNDPQGTSPNETEHVARRDLGRARRQAPLRFGRARHVDAGAAGPVTSDVDGQLKVALH